MSYTSKYTGQEIDGLLDSLNNGSIPTIAKAFLSKKVENIGIDTSFDMNIDKNNGLDISNNRIVLKANKSYIVRYTVEVCVGANEFGFGTSIPTDESEKWALLYSPVLSASNVANSGERVVLANPTEDIELTFTTAPYGSTVTYAWVKCIVEEFLANTQSIAGDTTPVGTVISVMRKKAPEGYLICDGRELNIADYKALADMFEEEFGSKNVYGGDGETTFAIPDLRNEFLRGYYGDKEDQLSGEIGIHQDATSHVNTYQKGQADQIGIYKTKNDKNADTNEFNAQAYNIDSVSEMASYYTISSDYGSTGASSANRVAYYTSRPTNVAVLYCIKY